jgi:hypothetical protein
VTRYYLSCPEQRDQPPDDGLGVGPQMRREEPRRACLRGHPAALRLEASQIALELDEPVCSLLAGLRDAGAARLPQPALPEVPGCGGARVDGGP